jgi:hypothetical protein
MVAVTGAKIAAGLRNADDRFARLQLAARQAVIQIAFKIERVHLGIVGVHEPLPRSEVFLFDFCHCSILTIRRQSRGVVP